MHSNKLVVFNRLFEITLFANFNRLINDYNSPKVEKKELQNLYYKCLHSLLEEAARFGLVGDLWHGYLTLLLVTEENVFSLACERKDLSLDTLSDVALMDITFIKSLFHYDFHSLESALEVSGLEVLRDYRVKNSQGILNKTMRLGLIELGRSMGEAESPIEFLKILSEHYKNYGVGK